MSMRKKPKKWSQQEIQFLKDNYYKTSCKYCAEKLNLPIDIVYGKIGRLKLKKECKYDINIFKNITSKYVSYILGFIWADGYVRHDSMILSIIKTDGDVIKPIFDEIGYYKMSTMKEYKMNKEKLSFRLCSVELCDLFRSFNYDKKSNMSPDDIIEKIPNNLKKYFFRGLIDGDGCFYVNKKTYNYQFTITSTYQQDWSYMISLCEYLNISKYKIISKNIISKKTNKTNKSSQFLICKRKDITILGDYIYSNYDNVGLKRKYNKFLDAKI